MKLITAIIKPHKLDDVKDALKAAGATGIAGIIKGEWGQLGAQALGALVIWTVIFGIAFGFFKIQNKITKGGIRSTEEDEIGGLDLPEMGVLGYND